MRVLTQTELSRCTRGELSALLNSIVQTLPALPEGSQELQSAHKNLQNIRRSLGPNTQCDPNLTVGSLGIVGADFAPATLGERPNVKALHIQTILVQCPLKLVSARTITGKIEQPQFH